ncbi:MAG: SufE family protein [Rhizobiaceae bacterium]|nr:SufE family protein [Rhizobiaceae bacterium]
MATLDDIISDFEFIVDWEELYRYVIDLGKKLPDLSDDEMSAENKVQGCVSQVWLISEPDMSDGDNPIMHFRGASDAHIVSGLVAIMLTAFSGVPAKEVAHVNENEIFERLGLIEHLTPQRANGLRAMAARIKQHAADVLP